MSPTAAQPSMPLQQKSRVVALDLLRGFVMVLMALDHVRDFFHRDVLYFSPDDIAKTYPSLFFTRFITHYCAPVFCFLAGSSAFFTGRRLTKSALSAWLAKRGFWLWFVEWVIMTIGWYFNFTSTLDLGVIWCLGTCMLFLALLIHLPSALVLPLSLFLVFGHNLFDSYHPAAEMPWGKIWQVLHIEGPVQMVGLDIYVVYPILPWIGLMVLGYHFARLYSPERDAIKRKRILISLGTTMTLFFFVFRYFNHYGDLHQWQRYDSPSRTLISFFNVTKYPISFDFVCITMGPVLLTLPFMEQLKGKAVNFFVIFGRVPLFYYIVHIYLIHLLALIAAPLCGFSPKYLILNQFVTAASNLKGYGFSLPVVYLVWLLVVFIMYLLCRKYDLYKTSHKGKWWLNYI